MYQMGEEEVEAAARVLRARKLFRYNPDQGAGPAECELFEKEWAAKLGVPHTLLVSTGTAGLICALVGLGIEPGDEVIVPGYTFMATALAPLAMGAVPVLADVDAGLGLDPQDVARKITPRTKAVIPVHMSGHVADLDGLLAVVKGRGIKVLEDACQCVGGSYKGKRVGTIGDAGAYSFNYFKIISAGEGGAFCAKDVETYQRGRIYHDTGCAFRYDANKLQIPVFGGVNYRMDELRAAVLRVQLGRLDGIIAGLRKNYTKLRERLVGAPGIEFAPVHSPDGHCGACLYLRVESRAEAQALEQEGRAKGVGLALPFDSGRHVYTNWDPLMQRRGAFHPKIDPLHITEAGRAQKYAPDMLPKTLEHLERTVTVHIGLNWTEADIERTAQALRALFKNRQTANAV
ncbi:MAG: DegT/DnrJ/EryC1/StrS family aminotransferase [Planctomycetes bacterium]|nr:DegT/DnrJ/EryC1/StrS family aminotransferase [Planctomycetota bacterium]